VTNNTFACHLAVEQLSVTRPRCVLGLAPFLTLLLTLLFPVQAIADEEINGKVARIAVISDINGRYGSTEYHPRLDAAINRIIELRPSVVISTGDMVAGQRPTPKLTPQELVAMWRSFHLRVRVPLEQAGIPLIMTPGNHDASAYPGYEHERQAYANYHQDHPSSLTPQPGGQFPYYFAIEHQHVLLVSVDATRTGPLSPPQHEWLETQLQQPGAKILFGHLPLQPVARGRERDIVDDPDLEVLLGKYSVAAYLSGHHHAWFPGHRRGVNMLSIGNLGGNQRALIGTDQKTGFSFTLLDIDASGSMKVRAFAAPDFTEPVDILSLPESIGKGDRQLMRRDLVNDKK